MMDNRAIIDEVLVAAKRLLPADGARLKTLPVQLCEEAQSSWDYVSLPQWAVDLVPGGKPGLFVPCYGRARNWEEYDWWRGAHDLLSCAWERAWEKQYGAIHSYSIRLGREVQPAFDHAWVNRIILFLRRWWATTHQMDETQAFGALPRPRLHLTHDVDAVKKTLAIRFKKAAFMLFNAVRFCKPQLLWQAVIYVVQPAEYWQMDVVAEMEKRYNRRSLWNLYGGWRCSPLALLMDPGYDITHPNISAAFRALHAQGHKIGVHPAFGSWKNSDAMATEKKHIEAAIGVPVTSCRQHWLRFSFAESWRAQRAAGLTEDMTLGFNDRMGFRNSAALAYMDAGTQVIPLVLMDSQLYDYAWMDKTARERAIDALLEELKATGGEASVLWHPHTFHPDFGWGESYEYLLKRMDALGFES